MSNWVTASNTDYWYGSYGVTYAGGGIWDGGYGPSHSVWGEQWNSPFKPSYDYYYNYTPGATHYGIRFPLTWNPTLESNADVTIRIHTTLSGYGYHEQVLLFTAGASTTQNCLITWAPSEGERVDRIEIGGYTGDFGYQYGSTPLIGPIEVDVEGGDDDVEGEDHDISSFLYKTTGQIEIITPDPPPAPPPIIAPPDNGTPMPPGGYPPPTSWGSSSYNPPSPPSNGGGGGGGGGGNPPSGGSHICIIVIPAGYSGIQIPADCM